MISFPWGWVLLAGGLVLLGCGAWVLWHGRKWLNRQDVHNNGEATGRRRLRVSEPTRVVLALVLLIAGYHGCVWAVPAQKTPLQLPRQWWWAWVLIGAGMIPASLAADRLERRRLGGDDEDR